MACRPIPSIVADIDSLIEAVIAMPSNNKSAVSKQSQTTIDDSTSNNFTFPNMLMQIKQDSNTNINPKHEDSDNEMDKSSLDYNMTSRYFIEKSKPKTHQISNYSVGKKQDLLICGYIYQIRNIYVPSVIMDIIKQFHKSFYKFVPYHGDQFEMYGNGTIIASNGYCNGSTFIFYTQSLMDTDCEGVHYWSINTLTTSYEAFEYIGVHRKVRISNSCKAFNVNKHSYRFKPRKSMWPEKNQWKENQILTAKLDYTNNSVEFYIDNDPYPKSSPLLIKPGLTYYFVVAIKSLPLTRVQIVETPKRLKYYW